MSLNTLFSIASIDTMELQ